MAHKPDSFLKVVNQANLQDKLQQIKQEEKREKFQAHLKEKVLEGKLMQLDATKTLLNKKNLNQCNTNNVGEAEKKDQGQAGLNSPRDPEYQIEQLKFEVWGQEQEEEEEKPNQNRGQELLMMGICDWTFFERKLTNDPNYQMPSNFLVGKLKTEEWNNIPPPLTTAFEDFKTCFRFTSNIMQDLYRQTRTRTGHIATKIKRMEQGLENASVTLKRQLELHNKHMIELQEASKKRLDRFMIEQETKMSILHQELQNDREFLNSRLMQVDDSIVIKRWVQQRLDAVYNELKTAVDDHYTEYKEDKERIWEENLTVPDIIGPGRCPFDNLQQYIKHSLKTSGQIQEDNRKQVLEKTMLAQNQFKQKLLNQIWDLKDLVQQKQETSDKKLAQLETTYKSDGEKLKHKYNSEIHRLDRQSDRMMTDLRCSQAEFSEVKRWLDGQKDKFKENVVQMEDLIKKDRDQQKEEMDQRMRQKDRELDKKLTDLENKLKVFVQNRNRQMGPLSMNRADSPSGSICSSVSPQKFNGMIAQNAVGQAVANLQRSMTRFQPGSPIKKASSRKEFMQKRDAKQNLKENSDAKKAMVQANQLNGLYLEELVLNMNEEVQGGITEVDESICTDPSISVGRRSNAKSIAAGPPAMTKYEKLFTQMRRQTTNVNSIEISNCDDRPQGTIVSSQRSYSSIGKGSVPQSTTKKVNNQETQNLLRPRPSKFSQESQVENTSCHSLKSRRKNLSLAFVPKQNFFSSKQLDVLGSPNKQERDLPSKVEEIKSPQKVKRSVAQSTILKDETAVLHIEQKKEIISLKKIQSESQTQVQCDQDSLTVSDDITSRKSQKVKESARGEKITYKSDIQRNSKSTGNKTEVKKTKKKVKESKGTESKQKSGKVRDSNQFVQLDKVEQMIKERIEQALKSRDRDVPSQTKQVDKTPPSHLKDYINKQIDKKFGKTIYGYQIPANQPAPLNVDLLKRNKSQRTTSLDKKTIMELVKSQIRTEFTQFQSIAGKNKQSKPGAGKNTIMDILSDKNNMLEETTRVNVADSQKKPASDMKIQGDTINKVTARTTNIISGELQTGLGSDDKTDGKSLGISNSIQIRTHRSIVPENQKLVNNNHQHSVDELDYGLQIQSKDMPQQISVDKAPLNSNSVSNMSKTRRQFHELMLEQQQNYDVSIGYAGPTLMSGSKKLSQRIQTARLGSQRSNPTHLQFARGSTQSNREHQLNSARQADHVNHIIRFQDLSQLDRHQQFKFTQILSPQNYQKMNNFGFANHEHQQAFVDTTQGSVKMSGQQMRSHAGNKFTVATSAQFGNSALSTESVGQIVGGPLPYDNDNSKCGTNNSFIVSHQIHHERQRPKTINNYNNRKRMRNQKKAPHVLIFENDK